MTTAIRDFVKQLGSTPRDVRRNFEVMVYCGLELFASRKEIQGVARSTFFCSTDVLQKSRHPDVDVHQMAALMESYLECVAEAPPFTDVLTLVHAELLATGSGDGLGQYFTPWDAASFSAKLAANHARMHGNFSATGPIKIHDPAVGAGALLLALVRQAGPEILPPARAHIHAIDIDPFCCAMTALQFAANAYMHQMPVGKLEVFEGNTLLPSDTWRLYWQAVIN